MKKLLLLGLAVLVLSSTGCRSLFTSGSNTVQSPWKTFAEAKTAFDQIIPGQSTTNELECLGFDPFSSANVRILTYLDVISRFLPNNSIQKTDLPEPVRACLEAKDSCQAYELDLTVTRSKRYGNLFLDIRVTPGASFSQLTDVLVLAPSPAVAEGPGGVRSARP